MIGVTGLAYAPALRVMRKQDHPVIRPLVPARLLADLCLTVRVLSWGYDGVFEGAFRNIHGLQYLALQ